MGARMLHTAGITGVGMDFPTKKLTNRDLEQMVDTNDAWITERTGIKERRIVEPGTPASVHGVEAARQAMAMAGAEPEEIDLIVVPTVTPDMLFPSTCCIIQEALGLKNAWCLEVDAVLPHAWEAELVARLREEALRADSIAASSLPDPMVSVGLAAPPVGKTEPPIT